ncbi:hypothetical protein V499_00886 [Pseudogymnoascus sp. VKM F-103]|nr:hypothetical protein V499_00886 [Pseudogymnoascus sp. VKM F-103]
MKSRERKKEYLQELEDKLRQYKLKCIEASSEMQGAAGKVIEENRRLGLLLARHVLSHNDTSDDDVSQQWSANPTLECSETQSFLPETSTMLGELSLDEEASQQLYGLDNLPSQLQTSCDEEPFQPHTLWYEEASQQLYGLDNLPSQLQTSCDEEPFQPHTLWYEEASQQLYGLDNLPSQLQTSCDEEPFQPQTLWYEEASQQLYGPDNLPSVTTTEFLLNNDASEIPDDESSLEYFYMSGLKRVSSSEEQRLLLTGTGGAGYGQQVPPYVECMQSMQLTDKAKPERQNCKLALKDSSDNNESRAVSALLQMKSKDGREDQLVALISKTPYQRPKYERLFCDLCGDREGFRGAHELCRHKDHQHKQLVQKWVCIEPVDGIKDEFRLVSPLANCKACKENKKYGAYYNAAAHLRRTHFVPNPCGGIESGKSDNKSEKRSGNGGGDWPPMKELKRWMKDVHESAVAVQQDDDDDDDDDDDEMAFSRTPISYTGGIPAHFNIGMGTWMEKDMFEGSGGIESSCAKPTTALK